MTRCTLLALALISLSICSFVSQSQEQIREVLVVYTDKYDKTVPPGKSVTFNWTLKNTNPDEDYDIIIKAKSTEEQKDWRLDISPDEFLIRKSTHSRSTRNLTLSVDAPNKDYGELKCIIDVSIRFNDKPYDFITLYANVTIKTEHKVLGMFKNPYPTLIDTNIKMFLLNIALWVVIGSLVVLFLDIVIRKATKKTKSEIDNIVLKTIRIPIIVIIGMYGVVSSLRVLELQENIIEIISRVYFIGLVFVAVWIFYKILKDVIVYYGRIYASKTNTQIDDILVPIVEKVGAVIVIIAGIGIILAHLGIDLTVLAIGSVVISMVLAFALQDTLSNFFSGIYILTDRPFKTGDTIKLESGETCQITKIGLRSTRLYNMLDHTEIIIPNNTLAKDIIVNYTEPDERFRVTISVGVAYNTDVDKVKRILLDISSSHPDVLKEKSYEPSVRFKEFGESSLNFQLLVWIDQVGKRHDVITDINTEIHKRFKEEGIEIPYPQRVLHIKEGKLM